MRLPTFKDFLHPEIFLLLHMHLAVTEISSVFRKVDNEGDKHHLQNDLDKLIKWSEKWQMIFNFVKM